MKSSLGHHIFLAAGWLGMILGGTVSLYADKPTCPVMKGVSTRPQFSVEYEGRTIELCCASCVRIFKRNPSKYS